MNKRKVLIDRWGNMCWSFNGKLHREGFPAVVYFDSREEWWIEGLLHRIDGPAITHVGGGVAWYLKGVWLDEEEYNSKVFGYIE